MNKASNFLPGKVCPNCKESTDTHSGTDTNPGAITVCLYCAQVNVFEQDMILRPITTAELQEILTKQPESFGQIVQAVSYIKNKQLFSYNQQ